MGMRKKLHDLKNWCPQPSSRFPSKLRQITNPIKQPQKTILLGSFLVTIFIASFLATFYSISLLTIEYENKRFYSTPQGSSDVGESWKSQLVSVGPAPGRANVSRDTLIWINGARPVEVNNVTIFPEVNIANETNSVYHVSTSVFNIYPDSLLQPNTTYTVTARVAGKFSSWNFTTSAEPSQFTVTQVKTSPYLLQNDNWVSLILAIIVTSLVGLTTSWVIRRRSRHG